MILLLILLLPYLYLLTVYILGWERPEPEYAPTPTAEGAPISIVVPMRNEAACVDGLLKQLLTQDYPSDRYEIVVVNDYSQDETRQHVERIAQKSSRIRLIDNTLSPGKKYALQCGVIAARFPVVVTLDADVSVQNNYLSAIGHCFMQYKPDLLIGPLKYLPVKALFASWFARIEMVVLTTIAGASAKIGRPVLCNGANLAFRREFFINNIPQLHHRYASGDDIFLMLAGKRQRARIIYAQSEGSFVSAYPPTTIRNLLRQRVRWLSKSGAYSDAHLQGLAVATALANISVVAGIVGVLSGSLSLLGLLIPWMLKITVESLLFSRGKRLFGIRARLWEIVGFGLLYPVYGCILVITYTLRIQVRWK